MQSRQRIGEHDHSAAAEDHPALGRSPGQEVGKLGTDASLVGVDALDRLSREHCRGPCQPADEAAVPLGFFRSRKRRGERAVEERHTQRVRQARRDEIAARPVLGRHRHEGAVGRRGCRPPCHHHPEDHGTRQLGGECVCLLAGRAGQGSCVATSEQLRRDAAVGDDDDRDRVPAACLLARSGYESARSKNRASYAR